MNFKGKLIHKGTIQELPNGLKIEFVVEKPTQNPDYPERALFTMYKSGDYADMVKKLPNIGAEVDVEFNFNANEGKGNYEGRWFGNVSAWKVSVLEGTVQENQTVEEEKEDLPF